VNNNKQLEEGKLRFFSRNRPFFFFQKLIDALGIVLMSAVVAIIIRK